MSGRSRFCEGGCGIESMHLIAMLDDGSLENCVLCGEVYKTSLPDKYGMRRVKKTTIKHEFERMRKKIRVFEGGQHDQRRNQG